MITTRTSVKTKVVDPSPTPAFAGNNPNQRDPNAVRRTVSGLLKLICPDAGYTNETVRKCLE